VRRACMPCMEGEGQHTPKHPTPGSGFLLVRDRLDGRGDVSFRATSAPGPGGVADGDVAKSVRPVAGATSAWATRRDGQARRWHPRIQERDARQLGGGQDGDRGPAGPPPIVLLSGADQGVWIDLDSTVEQILMVPHGLGAAPAGREVFVEAVAAADLDLSAVCLEYIKYLEAASTATEMALAVKLLTGSGTPGQQGELRIVLMTAA
jgi:hypothetical protein